MKQWYTIRSIRIAAVAALIFCLLIALTIFLAVLFAPQVATWALQKFAPMRPLQTKAFRVSDLGLSSARIEIETISGEAWSISGGSLTLQYSISRLWELQSVDEIVLSDAVIQVNVNTLLSKSSSNGDPSHSKPSEKSAMEAASTLLGSLKTPFQHFLISRSILKLQTAQHSENWQLDAEILTKDQQIQRVQFRFKNEDSPATTNFEVNADASFSMDISLALKNTLFSLNTWYPQWRSLPGLDPDLEAQIGASAFKLNAKGPLSNPINSRFDANLVIEGLRMQLGENSAEFSPLKLHLKSNPDESPDIHLDIRADKQDYSLAGFHLLSTDSWITMTTTRAQPLEKLELSFLTKVNSEDRYRVQKLSGALKGTAAFSGSNPLGTLILDARINDIILQSNNTMASFDPLIIAGYAKELRVNTDKIILGPDPGDVVEDIRMTFLFSDAFTNISAKIDASLPRRSSWSSLPRLHSSAMDFHMKMNHVLGKALEAQLELSPSPNTAFELGYAESFKLNGQPILKIEFKSPYLKDSWNAGIQLHLKNGQGQLYGARLSGLNARLDLSIDQTVLPAFRESNQQARIAALVPGIEAAMTWEADDISFSGYSLRWPEGSLMAAESMLHLSMNAAQLKNPSKVMPRKLAMKTQVDAGQWPLVQLNAEFDAEIDGIPLSIHGTLLGNALLHHQPWIFNTSLNAFTLEYSDILSRLIPSADGLIISGTVSSQVNGSLSGSSYDASLQLNLTKAALELPASQISAMGIEGTVAVDSLRNFTSQAFSNQIKLDSVKLGDIVAENTTLSWSYLPNGEIRIDTAHSEILGGKITLAPSTLKTSPLTLASQLKIESISLQKLAEYVTLFDGRLEGQIEGVIPFTLRDGQFIPISAQLQLPKNTQAKLYYAATEVIQNLGGPPNFILKQLKLEPGTVLSDALSDLTIKTFQMNLFPADNPEAALTIQISGQGKTGTTTVPVIIDIPVYGSFEELYLFILRLSSLTQ